MTSGKDDEEFFRARGFGVKIGFGERPALIVIDMIKGFTNKDMPLGAPLESQIAAQKPMIDVAHERGIPVIFSTVMYADHDMADAGLWAIKMKGIATLQAGTEAVEVDPRLGMRGTDSLLVKKYASCFFGTDLVPRLTHRGIDTLIITGTLTNCCCESTARDALQMGYKVIFMSDANATLSDEEHLGTLLSMYTIFADVMDTPYLLDLIEKSTATKAAA